MLKLQRRKKLSKKEIREKAFIVRILEMFEEKSKKMLTVQWIWRPEEVKIDFDFEEKEILLDTSFKFDCKLKFESIIDICQILILDKKTY